MNTKTEKPNVFDAKTEKPIYKIAKTAKSRIPMPPSINNGYSISLGKLLNHNREKLSGQVGAFVEISS